MYKDIDDIELEEALQDLSKMQALVTMLIESSNEAAKSLMRVGGMLNKDLAYDITKITSELEKLRKKYESRV